MQPDLEGAAAAALSKARAQQPSLSGPIIIALADRDSVMEGLDDYCNQTVSMGPSSPSAVATAAAAGASEAGPATPSVRAEKSLMFDRFPAVLGLHLNR